MTSLKLVSLDDAVVFPGMPVTLPADVGNDTRVLLIPRRGSGYAKVGVVAEVSERVAVGGRGVASLMALHRGVPGAAHTDPDGVLRVDVDERPDVGAAAEPDARARARVSRRGRGNSRAARRRWPDQRVRPLDHPSGRAGRHRRLLARSEHRPEARAARNARRRRAADAGAAVPAGAAGRAARPQAHPRRRRDPARRNSSASISCAGRWTRSARSSARTTARLPRNTARRSPPPACPRRSSSRPSASCRDSSGWATRTPKRR